MTKKINGFFSQPRVADLLVLVAGLLLPFAFAPYNLAYLAFPLFAIFSYLLINQSNRRSFWRGWLFGFGQFVFAFSWIFHSIHTFGQAPAALAVIMIILLAAYCAIYTGLAAYLSQKFFSYNVFVFLLAGLPLMWALTEWLRGYVFTGFPWLAAGVSQTDTSLAYFASVLGALGIGAIVVLISGLIVLMVLLPQRIRIYLPAVILIFLFGQLLSIINWSETISEPLKVSVLQLSITQDQKWESENKIPSMNWYLQQTLAHKDSDIIVWPETAIPSFINRVKPYWNRVINQAEESQTDVIVGVFMRDEETGRYYNSMVGTNGDYYQKKHLVPLGEYMPFRGVFEFLRNYIHFPLSNIANGKDDQPLMTIAGHAAGVSICFEDVFDRDIRSALPEAKFLINASNDGWFKMTAEPFQHHQIARMRAMEASRFMIRATSTGVSSIIGPKGEELVTSKMFDKTTISGEIRAMKGATPFVFWGNWPLILLGVLGLGWRVYVGLQNRHTSQK